MKVSQIQPAGIYLVIVNNSNNGTRCEICSKLTTKTPKRQRRFVVFFVNFEHISHVVLVVLLLTLNIYWPAGKFLLFQLFVTTLRISVFRLFTSGFCWIFFQEKLVWSTDFLRKRLQKVKLGNGLCLVLPWIRDFVTRGVSPLTISNVSGTCICKIVVKSFYMVYDIIIFNFMQVSASKAAGRVNGIPTTKWHFSVPSTALVFSSQKKTSF